jgi:hypothetical protein
MIIGAPARGFIVWYVGCQAIRRSKHAKRARLFRGAGIGVDYSILDTNYLSP